MNPQRYDVRTSKGRPGIKKQPSGLGWAEQSTRLTAFREMNA